MSFLRSAWKSALRISGRVIPAAGREYHRMQAQDFFNQASNSKTKIGKLLFLGSQSCLQMAGEDILSDKPYQEILGLKGGKKEFDAIVPDFVRNPQLSPE